MIQKISFGSKYLFTKVSDNKRYPSAIAASVAQANLMYLKNEDKICIRNKNVAYGVEVPNYMDEQIEKYCKYSGIKYIKY